MRVILFLLKCIVGLFATLGVLVVGLVVLVASHLEDFDHFTPTPVEPAADSVLLLDLTGGVVELRPDNPFSRASLGPVIEMREIVETLAMAGRDERIKGALVRVGGGGFGLADVQEVRDALQGFQDQGKFVVSFAESFGELGNGTLDYFLASVGDQVWLQPSGDLDLTGFAIESPFAKDLLDMVGVEPEMAEREEFKGVLSGFKHNQMPEPQRQNLQQLLDSWLGQIAAGIAASRDMAPDAVRQAINQAPYGARDGAAQGLIDELGYWDQVTQATLEQVGDDASFLDFFDYHAAVGSSDPTALAEGEVNTIALIYGLGPVTMGASENDPVFGDTVMGSDTVATALSDAIDDPDIAAIVFRVDSPGGSYVASDTIWREVQRAREAEKPVILTMGNLAASGGYFVAAPATKIVAQPGTITGSIGVAAGKFDLSGLWDKLGVHWDVVKAGDNADLWSSTESFTDDGWDHLNASLDRTYADFLNKVAQGRGFNDEEVRQVAKGQVWTGADALNLGLIDALGGFDTAFALARSEAGLATDAPLSIRRFPEPVDPFQALLEEFFLSEISAPLLRPLAGLAESLRPWLSKLEQLSAGGPQPRLQWEPPQEAR